jgi:hypothetical protein
MSKGRFTVSHFKKVRPHPLLQPGFKCVNSEAEFDCNNVLITCQKLFGGKSLFSH